MSGHTTNPVTDRDGVQHRSGVKDMILKSPKRPKPKPQKVTYQGQQKIEVVTSAKKAILESMDT